MAKGKITVNETSYRDGQLLVFDQGVDPVIVAATHSVLMMLGGELLGERYIGWNFVSSRKERIEQAKEDWMQGQILLRPTDNTEFIPLPAGYSKPAGGPPPNALS